MATIETIAQRTMLLPFRKWAFGETIALQALLEASVATANQDYRRFVESICLETISGGCVLSQDRHVAPGIVFLDLYRQSRNRVWLSAAAELIDFHEHLPVTPLGAPLVRAQQPGWAYQIWVDSIDVIGPLYAAYSQSTGDKRWMRRAVEITLAYARHLQRADGLFFHGFDLHAGQNGHCWARGQGWALLGIADVLIAARAEPLVAELRSCCESLLDALARSQCPSGMWTTVVDHRETYEEAALAAMLTCAVAQLRKAGIAVSTVVAAVEKRARAAVRRLVDDTGALGRVSVATPVGQLSTYATRPFGVFPWGQGPLLLMECLP